MDNLSSSNTIFNWVKVHKKKLLLILFPIFIGIFLLGFFFPTNDTQQSPQTFPSPTGISTITQFKTIPTGRVAQESQKIVKNPHWLNNNELAYTYYDSQDLQTIVAKTDRENETVLSRGVRIKFADFYWSRDNLLLVHELTSPSKAYLLTKDNVLENLNIRGLAYSWAPDSRQFFYANRGDGSQFLPSYYTLESKSSATASIPKVDFTHALWSPSADQLLLYTKGFDVQDANPYILHRASNELLPINTNAFYSPAWSPTGEKLAYITDQGVMIRNKSGGETLFYKTPSPQTITFTWLNDQELFLIDSTNRQTRKLILSLQRRDTQEVFTNLSLTPDQRIEMALSPDKKTLALATEKNGLLFLSLP